MTILTVAYGDGRYTIQHGTGSELKILGKLTLGTNGNDNGDDKLVGTDGADLLVGLGGDDTLEGGLGDDTLYGGAHHDTLRGGAGSDTLYGGKGNDILIGGADGDTFDGGGGSDTISYAGYVGDAPTDGIDPADGVSVNLNRNTFSKGDAEGDSIAAGALGSVENLIGSAGNDNLSGDAGVNKLTGGLGYDYLYGDAGDDILEGGGGTGDSYVFEGGYGADTIQGDTDGGFLRFLSAMNLDGFAFSLEDNGNLLITDGSNSVTIKDYADGLFTLQHNSASGIKTVGKLTLGTDGATRNRCGNRRQWRHADLILGLSGDDTLEGGLGDDTLYGGAHHDTLRGGAGSDTLYGGRGKDILEGGADNDILEGGGGADTFDGGGGSDTISYASSNAGVSVNLELGTFSKGDATGDSIATGAIGSIENIRGSIYGDTLTGDTRANTLTGDRGDDTLEGGLGDDTLYGGAHHDTLRGGAGADTLYGGRGNDILEGGADGDTFDGGGGSDTISYAGYVGDAPTDGVSVNLNRNTFSKGDAEGDSIAAGALGSVENLIGSAGNDNLSGDAGVNKLTGGLGDDYLYGDAGDDILEGGGGTGDSYVFEGGYGADTIQGDTDGGTLSFLNAGGAGDFRFSRAGTNSDVFITHGSNSVKIVAAAYADGRYTIQHGTDSGIKTLGRLTVATPEGGTIAPSTVDDLRDLMVGSIGGDTLQGQGGNDILYGGDGEDTLEGGAGNDILYGGRHGDTLTGGAGNDYLYGERGGDTLEGGEGVDYLYGGGGVDKLYGGAGNDILDGGEGNDILRGGEGVDYLYGGGGVDKLYGGAEQDVLDGGEGDDILEGGAGNDQFYAGAGNDILYGDVGNDILFGDAGNDILYGGANNDKLYGGAGEDTYVFEVGGGADSVSDVSNDELTLFFQGADYEAADFREASNNFNRVGNNLEITLDKNSDDGVVDKVTILNAYDSNPDTGTGLSAFTIHVAYGSEGSFTEVSNDFWQNILS